MGGGFKTKIIAIQTELIDVPTIRPHVLAMATMNVQTLCLVRLQCDDGVEGLGEATTIGGLAYGPEAPESIQLLIDTYFAPLLQGRDPSRPAELMALLGKHIVGNHFAKCAIETALRDDTRMERVVLAAFEPEMAEIWRLALAAARR